ncbi:hypothetical protein QBC32DRAFT_346629 [Pseudoneurospora amorphoporcata]|uniref:Uncharacterized protein n=1 Tax=Pseudoneurospora amorphoporcata TaxID=241081 RepID=A0AAN6NQV8_9PEZI|nr:hypothetical protein QBC32DRAFT_346629 [Pseudoneurospora amorphoporcata]
MSTYPILTSLFSYFMLKVSFYLISRLLQVLAPSFSLSLPFVVSSLRAVCFYLSISSQMKEKYEIYYHRTLKYSTLKAFYDLPC